MCKLSLLTVTICFQKLKIVRTYNSYTTHSSSFAPTQHKDRAITSHVLTLISYKRKRQIQRIMSSCSAIIIHRNYLIIEHMFFIVTSSSSKECLRRFPCFSGRLRGAVVFVETRISFVSLWILPNNAAFACSSSSNLD